MLSARCRRKPTQTEEPLSSLLPPLHCWRGEDKGSLYLHSTPASSMYPVPLALPMPTRTQHQKQIHIQVLPGILISQTIGIAHTQSFLSFLMDKWVSIPIHSIITSPASALGLTSDPPQMLWCSFLGKTKPPQPQCSDGVLLRGNKVNHHGNSGPSFYQGRKMSSRRWLTLKLSSVWYHAGGGAKRGKLGSPFISQCLAFKIDHISKKPMGYTDIKQLCKHWADA